MHYQNLKYHVRVGHLIPDEEMADRSYLFYPETVEKFCNEHVGMRADSISMKDVAKEYGVSYRLVWLRVKKHGLMPVAKVRYTSLYDLGQIKRMADDEGWTTSTSRGEDHCEIE